MTKQELIQAVRSHAVANYNKDGWDFLVECWEDSQIEEQIGNARTPQGAIKSCKRVVKMLSGHRREQMNMMHW